MDDQTPGSAKAAKLGERQAARLAARSGGDNKDNTLDRRIAARRRRMGVDGADAAPVERIGTPLEVKVKRLADEAELLRTKLFQVQRALIAGGLLKPAVLGSPEGEVVPEEYLLAGHDRAVLAFGGMASRLQMPPSEFGRTFGQRNVDLVFYKDLQQCWYQKGLLGLSDDVPSTVTHIGKTIAERRWRQVFVIGSSAGGFAAILFGASIGATHIVAFSPQTIIQAKTIRQFGSTDSRHEEIDLKAGKVDLAKVLEETGYAGRIDLYYGSGNELDVLAAEHLRRFPCVTLHPVDTASHNSARKLRDDGRFEKVFDFLG